jgi:EAL domain-containing protein (putative c-di-GMP-specific phosphodiesterase class I)
MPSAVEALVRWQHPVRGLVPPLDFIPTAERTGLIVPLTEYVLRSAVAQAVRWQRDGLSTALSVNVSPRSFHDADLVHLVRSVLTEAGLPAGSLTIEITEGSIMSRPAEALATMQQLREIGVRLSIDDFGTGYSSLAYLQRLPVTALKVDRSFVSAMRGNSGSRAIVRSTIDLAHDLGLTVVAEGVEDAATLDELARLKCDLAQGYHMCRPMPATDMTAWLASRQVAASR